MTLATAKANAVARGFTVLFRQEVRQNQPLYPEVCTVVPSSSKDEAYVGLGDTPGMREFLGDRQFHQLRSANFTIENKPWESSVGIDRHDIDDDRYGLYNPVVATMGLNASNHPDKILGDLIIAGESATCFDGQFFFDTDHAWGDSGTQSNDLGASAVSATAPTVAEWRTSLSAAVTAMLGFKTDQGDFYIRPRAATLSDLVALVPPSMYEVAVQTVEQTIRLEGGAGTSNVVVHRPRIVPYQYIGANYTGGSNAKWYLCYTGAPLRPFVFQSRSPLQVQIADADNIKEKDVKFMTEARYNVGYGAWFTSVLTTFS